jgi:hypothetical protein
MIEVTYPTSGDYGEYLGDGSVGYFNTIEEAQKALRGLCPWDFNSMWAPGDYKYFKFISKPGTLSKKDKRFIEFTNHELEKARIHAKEWKGSWHRRAPNNW